MADIGDILQTADIAKYIFKFTQKGAPNVNIKLVNKLFYGAVKHAQLYVMFNSCDDVFSLQLFKDYKQVYVSINFSIENNFVLRYILSYDNVNGIGMKLKPGVEYFSDSDSFDNIRTLHLFISECHDCEIGIISNFKNIRHLMITSNSCEDKNITYKHVVCPQLKFICIDNTYSFPTNLGLTNTYNYVYINEKSVMNFARDENCIKIRPSYDMITSKIFIRVDLQSYKKFITRANEICFEIKKLEYVKHLTILPLEKLIKSTYMLVDTPNLKTLTVNEDLNTMFKCSQPLLCLNIICYKDLIDVNKIGMMLAFYKPKATRIVVKHATGDPGEIFKELCKRYNVCLTVNNWNSNWHIPDD